MTIILDNNENIVQYGYRLIELVVTIIISSGTPSDEEVVNKMIRTLVLVYALNFLQFMSWEHLKEFPFMNGCVGLFHLR